MASITSIRPRPGERGQILLAGALILAILLVVLATVLNGTIAVGNITNTGGGNADIENAIRFQWTTHQAITELVVTVNTPSNTDPESDLTAGITDWDSLSSQLASKHGIGVNVAENTTVIGSLIQQNESQSFKSASNATKWNIVEQSESVEKSRAFEMNVSLDNSTSGFKVEANDGSKNWTMEFTSVNSTSISILVNNSSNDTTCLVNAGGTATIELTNGRLIGDDDECQFPPFAQEFDSGYNITYINADTVNGTYELVVDGDVNDNARYDNDGPTVSDAIYSTRVSIMFVTSRGTYETELLIAPGDRDA